MGRGDRGASVELAPNPATEKLRVVCRDKTLEGSRASVWSTDGRMMTSFVLEEETVLDIREWAVGVYLLRLADGNTLRLIKQ